MPKYNPDDVELRFNFIKPYTAPAANQLLFTFKINPYIPPKGDRLDFAFTERYTPPIGNNLSFSFVDEDSETTPIATDQFVFPEPIESGLLGDALAIRLKQRWVTVTGFNSFGIGTPGIRNDTQHVKPTGFDALGFSRQTIRNKNVSVSVTGMDLSRVSTPSIVNFHKNVNVSGFNAELFSKPTIYNLRKYVSVSGISGLTFGSIYLQGGVRYLNLTGISSLAFGAVKVVNTRADQKIQISGIAAPSVPQPNVSPQILTARGFLATLWGSPYVQRNPSPKGWSSEQYGTVWVSRSPRFYTVGIGELTQFGSAKIFDAKQNITVTGVIPGGIFGDIAIRNLNFKISPTSIAAPEITNWTSVVNTSRYYTLNGFNSAVFGQSNIRNATPSFKPDSIDSAVFGRALVADRIRRLNTAGFDLMRFGQAIVTKTQQLSPKSIDLSAMGVPTLTLYTRYLVTSGRVMTAMGEAFVAPAKRQYKIEGFAALKFGSVTLSHGIRSLLAKGSDHSALGTSHRVWFRVRSIAPESIYEEQKAYGHRIGGSQYITAKGFDASLFGRRIVPEIQTIIADTFKSSDFGIAALHKSKEILSVVGFATGGQQPADRWGRAKVYNSRQYIILTYNIDSDLNPPRMGWWTSIVNRNRYIGTTGVNTNVFGRASIKNNATLIQPSGIDARPLGIAFISHRIRSIKLEGIEQPYISGWTNAHNAAAVIKPKGFESMAFGKPIAVNNRRYFPRIGNFESMIFGEPMISFRVRTLGMESRYSIGPISFSIHKVQLYTRYLEVRSNDFMSFGNPSLIIHKNIITPRWYLKDLFGDVSLRNVTPEVKTKGRNAEEFGQASIRTQWRNVQAFGDNAQLLGKPIIAFRDRKITVNGFVGGAIGSALSVKGTASPPLSTQYIYLNNVENRGEGQNDDTNVVKDGQGIAIPLGQVSSPQLRTNVIRPEGFDAKRFGETDIYSNGILIENGIKLDKECGTPFVQLANRVLSVVGINNAIVVGMPRLSPHTIYAVMDAPQQAIDNHTPVSRHYVNSDSGYRKPGEVFGLARVWQHNPYLNVKSVEPNNKYGTPVVQLKRRYVEAKGIQAYRFGWHNIGDGTQNITHRQGAEFTVMGKPTIALIDDRLQIRTTGLNALAIGNLTIDFYHRTIKVSGINSLAMGTSRGQSNEYMPQSLHVGFPMPMKPVGNLMEKFGITYIGLKIRELQINGFDACLMEYDALNFDKRMRVKRGENNNSSTKPTQHVNAVGFDAFHSSASNVRPGVHYIRPDGNSDQFRKGGF